MWRHVPGTKKETTTTSKTSTPEVLPDYHEYIVNIDVKQYHSTFAALTDIRNNYIKAYASRSRLTCDLGEVYL